MRRIPSALALGMMAVFTHDTAHAAGRAIGGMVELQEGGSVCSGSGSSIAWIVGGLLLALVFIPRLHDAIVPKKR